MILSFRNFHSEDKCIFKSFLWSKPPTKGNPDPIKVFDDAVFLRCLRLTEASDVGLMSTQWPISVYPISINSRLVHRQPHQMMIVQDIPGTIPPCLYNLALHQIFIFGFHTKQNKKQNIWQHHPGKSP